MLVSTCYCIKPVEAIDFSKDESKYMSLCASGKLTNSNKKTCEEFNSYLKAKNKKLKKDLENQKSAAASTTQTLDSVQKKLNSLNSDISLSSCLSISVTSSLVVLYITAINSSPPSRPTKYSSETAMRSCLAKE